MNDEFLGIVEGVEIVYEPVCYAVSIHYTYGVFACHAFGDVFYGAGYF